MSSFVFHKIDSRHLLEVFPKTKTGFPKEVVDVTITSPPYWNLKDYGFKGQIGYGQPYNLYLQDLGKIFGNVFLVTKNTGSLWIVVDTFTKKDEDGPLIQGYERHELVPLTFDVIKVVRDSGWKLRDILIWQKDKTLPWSRNGQLRSIFEHILFFTKTNSYKFYTDRIRMPDHTHFKEWWVRFPERYSPNGITPTNLWYFPIPVQGSWAKGYTRHFCPFPSSLVQRILLLTTKKGNLVFDPFAGSGVVMAVSHSMNRRSIGLEPNPEFQERFQNHVLENVKKEMTLLTREQRRQTIRQRLLRRKIGRLRLTKYPRVLIKKLNLDVEQVTEINSVFAIGSNLSSGITGNWKDRLHEHLYVVLNSESKKDDLEKVARTVIRKPPLSKFGIEPKLRFLTKDDFISEESRSPSFDHNNLWVYINGITNLFYKKISFERWADLCETKLWKEFFKRNLPPIISNIRVRQPVPRTWVPHES
jgi:DNA modification methylase